MDSQPDSQHSSPGSDNQSSEKDSLQKKENPKSAKAFFASPRIRVALAIGLLVLLVVVLLIYLHARKYESTDDAFIEGHITQVSAEVSAFAVHIYVDDNFVVKQGQRLIDLDPRVYQAALDEAKANFEKAKADYSRVISLRSTGAISKEDLDSVQANLDVTQSRLEQAELNLSYTKIDAPVDGKVTQKNVELGDFIQPGVSLLALVQPQLWVIANFKETQLKHMHPGQKVTIRADAFPSRHFKGHVDSFQAGTGARFSLLPPENATGNYVKVVQRVPVKIIFDEPVEALKNLAPGMSVEPTVKIR